MKQNLLVCVCLSEMIALLLMLNAPLAGVAPTANDFIEPARAEYVFVRGCVKSADEPFVLKDETTLWEVIERCGGETGAGVQAAKITRAGMERESQIFEYNYAEVPASQRVDYLKLAPISAGDRIALMDSARPWANHGDATPSAKEIAVFGQVLQGGKRPWQNHASLQEVVNACGGLSRLFGGEVVITRQVSPTQRMRQVYHQQKGESQKAFLQRVQVQPGDVVYFAEIVC